MTRKQTILFFADYIHTIAMTYEKKKYRLLVEVDKRFMPADIKKVADKIGRKMKLCAMDGSHYLVIRF